MELTPNAGWADTRRPPDDRSDRESRLDPSKPPTTLLGTLPQVRALVETAIESVLTSGKDPKTALDDAAAQAKSLIEKYNAVVK